MARDAAAAIHDHEPEEDSYGIDGLARSHIAHSGRGRILQAREAAFATYPTV